jgi:hypothetical protein
MIGQALPAGDNKTDPTSGASSALGQWADALGGLPVSSSMVTFAVVAVVGVSIAYYWLKDRAARGSSGVVGGLNYVVGPMGSGKSMFGVRTISAALVQRKYVVTNVRLLPGWSEKLVRWHWPSRHADERARRARIFEGLYVYESDLRTAMRYRIPCAVCGADTRSCGHSGPEQEGRAVIVWDETHNDLNNRDWDGAGSTREERNEDRQRKRLLIRWATQLRKLGFVGYLLSQHHENTDKQLQRVCNSIIRLQNQRNAEGLWLARLLPRRWTLFLVYWYPAHLATDTVFGRVEPMKRERYWLPKERHLYDSWETYHGIDDGSAPETTPILLPAGGRMLDVGEGSRGAGVPASPPEQVTA